MLSSLLIEIDFGVLRAMRHHRALTAMPDNVCKRPACLLVLSNLARVNGFLVYESITHSHLSYLSHFYCCQSRNPSLSTHYYSYFRLHNTQDSSYGVTHQELGCTGGSSHRPGPKRVTRFSVARRFKSPDVAFLENVHRAGPSVLNHEGLTTVTNFR